MKLGIERLIEERFDLITHKRIGLLMHQASVDSRGNHTLDSLHAAGANITTLFGPEHGIATKAEDMEPVASRVDDATDTPVYSLYGDTFASLSPTPEMLEKIDVLVVDLQDIGSRYYTYIWTAVLAMKSCAKARKRVIVCDRPNPLGGAQVEGPVQKKGFESFVGLYPLAVRHGMTIGEICSYVNKEFSIGCDLHVMPMEGWQREMLWEDTGLSWVNPSPNMRSFTAAVLYPGMCLIEGTNVSEGRGTDTPFEIIGAPYIDSLALIECFSSINLLGVHATPTSFIPTMQKHRSAVCNGVRWVIGDVQAFRPYLTGLGIIWTINKLYKNKGFQWRAEAYEFARDIPAIDLLTGSAEFRTKIDSGFDELRYLGNVSNEFIEKRKRYLMYR